MALDNTKLKDKILAELATQGFTTKGHHAMAQPLATAIANAVVSHITESANVVVGGGSSAGSYKVS